MGLEGPTHLSLLFSWALEPGWGWGPPGRGERVGRHQPLWPNLPAPAQDPTAQELMSTDRAAFCSGQVLPFFPGLGSLAQTGNVD